MRRVSSHITRLATGAGVPASALLSVPRGASTDSTSAASASPSVSSPPSRPEASSRGAAFQHVYKSTHKGSGAVPLPTSAAPDAVKNKLKKLKGAGGKAEALFGARSSCAEDTGPLHERALSPLQKRQLLFRNKAAFVLTPQALRRVKFLLSQYAANHPEEVAAGGRVPTGIHIGVRRRGCSGYSYTVNYYFPPTAAETAEREARRQQKGKKAPSFLQEDVVVEQEGVLVVVEADALFYVIGTEMDYVVRNVEEKFTFKNPNQKYSCGCEESFMPFDEDDMDD